MPLTDVAVRTAKPASKPYKLTDGGGLFLLVQPSGGKWWRYKYRFGGKEKLLALGSYPDLSLAEARKFHAQARNVLALGNDPMEVKKEAKRQTSLKSDLSFEIVAKEWHQKQSRRWSAIHAKKTMRSLEADVFPKIGRRPIADISSSEMLTLLRKVESRGAIETAHRVMQNCSKVFSYAIATDRAERNPTTDLQGALETVRKKHNASLKEEQMPEFLSKLELYDKEYGGDLQTKLALKFLVLTFVRTIELRGAKWTEFHWDKAEWRIVRKRPGMAFGRPLARSLMKMASIQT
jgi:integrase